jgi:CheY-like chemotaxis protein
MLSIAPSGLGHILVVDDDETWTAAMAGMLQVAGYRVSVAHGFQTALPLLEGDDAIDLLLTDLVMPGSINGIALGRMAKLRLPNIKLVYVTGYDIPGAEEHADGPVLRKPIDDQAVLAQVARALTSAGVVQ